MWPWMQTEIQSFYSPLIPGPEQSWWGSLRRQKRSCLSAILPICGKNPKAQLPWRRLHNTLGAMCISRSCLPPAPLSLRVDWKPVSRRYKLCLKRSEWSWVVCWCLYSTVLKGYAGNPKPVYRRRNSVAPGLAAKHCWNPQPATGRPDSLGPRALLVHPLVCNSLKNGWMLPRAENSPNWGGKGRWGSTSSRPAWYT